MRARSAVLPGEDPALLRARLEAWTDSLRPRDEVDRFLVEKAVNISWMLDRAERALAAREAADRHGPLERSFQEADDVVLMGHRLLYDPRGPMALYPHGPIGFRGPWWISWSKDPDDEHQPAVVLNLLESCALGWAWLLDRWGELREVLEEGLNWQAPDRFKAIRLLGRQPLDALDDPRVMAIYTACAAMEPRGPHPIEDVRSEMSEEDWQRYRERVEDRGATAKRIKAPDEGLAVLLDLIAGEEERLEGVLAAHLAREEAERMEGPGFGDNKEAERLRRYQLTYNRMLLRILETLRKRRREAAREDKTGSSRRRVAASARDATNEATGPASSEVGSESVVFTDRCPPPSDPPLVGSPHPIPPEDLPVPEDVTNEATGPAASDVERESAVLTDRRPPATDHFPDRSPEQVPQTTEPAAGWATNEANGSAPKSPRPGPLVRALALFALLLPACAGHTASVAAGSNVGRAFRTDTSGIGPDSVVGGGSVRRPVGSDRVGWDRVQPESPTDADRAGSIRDRTAIAPGDRSP